MSKLPEWGHDDLPEPPPFSVRNMFRIVGPGAILLAGSIGGGEWLIGPSLAVKHGLNLMWIATLGIVLQLMFNLEAIRYTLYTGEPILSGIMRLRPGAKFWATVYVTLTIAQLGVPALAKGSAAVLFALLYHRAPESVPADQDMVLYMTYGVMLFAVLLLMFGGTIERMLERASWGMIAYIFVFLLYVNIRYVPASHWVETFSGFFQFGRFPAGFFEADVVGAGSKWMLVAALAATAGSGGIGNLAITNWIRDKGFGMGGKVGAIPSAFGSRQIQLSHVGKVFPVNATNLARWRTWWKYIAVDQVWLWGLGCFVGMFLNVNLATTIIPATADMTGPAAG
ncbi:MAG: Nramp family divalent metal transporter, partial [Planctomycetota bacterium]